MKYLGHLFCCITLIIPLACTKVESAKDRLNDNNNTISENDTKESFPTDKLTETKKQTIKAAEGGTITIGEGDNVSAELSIPAGALSEDTEITVFEIDASALPKNAAGPAYEFKPDGLQFSKAVTLKIKYTSDTTENLKLAQIFFNSDDFTALDNNSVDLEKKMVSGETKHFSAYAPVIDTHSNDSSTTDDTDTNSSTTTTDSSTITDDDKEIPNQETNDTDGGVDTNTDDDDVADDNDSDQTDDDSTTQTSDNCTKYAKALCEKEVSCKFASATSNVDCQKFAESYCKDWWMNRINKASTSKVDSCITAMNALACDKLSSGDDMSDPNCVEVFQGTIANGQPCGEILGDMCKEGHCEYDYNSSSMCGICTPFQKIGDNCADQYYCYLSASESVPCHEGKCTALPTENQPCISYDCADGLYCDYTDYNNQICKKETVVKENEDCSYGTGKVCDTGLECKYDSTTYNSTCVKKTLGLHLGDVCEYGKRCQWPSFCKVAQAKATQGICVIGSLPKTGEPCPLDSYCENGNRCDEATGLCIALLNDGDTCDPYEYGWDCKSSYCDETSNKCTVAVCQ